MFDVTQKAIGLHGHDEGDHGGHDHQGEGELVLEPYLWKMLSATLSVWMFFVLQLLLRLISNIYKQRQNDKKVSVNVHLQPWSVYLCGRIIVISSSSL